MTDNIRMPIHCCCNAERRVGYVSVPLQSVEAYNVIRLPVLRKPSFAGALGDVGDLTLLNAMGYTVETILDFEIAPIYINSQVGYILALKSNDYPEDQLRRLQTFDEQQ